MARRLDRAERLRRHREELQLALVEGLTLDQARERLDSYRANLARLAAPVVEAIACFPAPRDPVVMWWQRD